MATETNTNDRRLARRLPRRASETPPSRAPSTRRARLDGRPLRQADDPFGSLDLAVGPDDREAGRRHRWAELDAAAARLDAIATQAQRALLIQLGAAAELRDTLAETAQTFTNLEKVVRELERFERRGERVLDRGQRTVIRRRRDIQHEVRNAQRDLGRQANGLRQDAEGVVDRIKNPA
jgi:hypothetical protein